MKKYFLCMLMMTLLLVAGGCRAGLEEGASQEISRGEAQTTVAGYENVTESDAGMEETNTTSDKIEQLLSAMSLEQKVGQMFIVRCPDVRAVEDVRTYGFGGYILFARDFQGRNASEVRQAIGSYQEAADVPMLIAVDEEGGKVVRVSKYGAFRKEPFASPLSIYQEGGVELLQADAHEKSLLLKSLGINMNLAPVCDVADSEQDYIYERTLGTDAKIAKAGIAGIVSRMEADGMMSVLKHFPGYGSNVDTHTGIAHDDRAMEIFENEDFLPFKAGIEAGSPCVMVSHNIVTCMDSALPASLSPKVNKVLREKIGFDGVVMTDSLSMNAITLYTGNEQAAVMAVKAGNDLLCVDDYKVQIPAVVEAVKKGEISVARIDESVRRILQMKLEYGLLSE